MHEILMHTSELKCAQLMKLLVVVHSYCTPILDKDVICGFLMLSWYTTPRLAIDICNIKHTE